MRMSDKPGHTSEAMEAFKVLGIMAALITLAGLLTYATITHSDNPITNTLYWVGQHLPKIKPINA